MDKKNDSDTLNHFCLSYLYDYKNKVRYCLRTDLT